MDIRRIFETMEYGPAPESKALANDWLDAHDRQFELFIDGDWRAPAGAGYFDSVNPGNEETLARIAEAGPEDVDAAVAAARAALPKWRDLGGHGRARFLYAIARHIQKNSRLFAVLETLDNGKPIRETRDIDIPLVARHFYHHAGWAQVMETEMPGYKEVGVVGQIIPWNFPLLMLAWKIAPALAMGNTVVLKPAEFTSITAMAFAELCRGVGLPPGVVNIVTGAGKTGALIVDHEGVDKIAFTGSTEVGRVIRRATAGTGKKLSLELGGKSPFIVFDDADLDSVVEGVVDAIWFNQGQVCCAGSRLLVQENAAQQVIDKIKARMEKLRVGDPLDKCIDIGAIIAPVQLQKIQALVEQGVDEGGKLWQPSWACPKDGYFYPPTLFTDVAPSAMIAQVEIFGPVLVSMTFRTPAEAVALANNTRFGLAASVWTENINLALDIAPKIKAGSVWINCTNMFDAASGFGGYRESGFGREGGKEGLYEYAKPAWEEAWREPKPAKSAPKPKKEKGGLFQTPTIDRTAKMYIGGKQARPDGGYSYPVHGSKGEWLGEASLGNRKDIRNAVEAAHKCKAWPAANGHNRAQVLYYIAENLSARSAEFTARLTAMTGKAKAAERETAAAVERLYYYAAMADKYDGRVHHTPIRNVTLAMPESIGAVGVVCPEDAPLLAFVSLTAPLLAMGNCVIVLPSQVHPLAATDFYQVLDTSDLPGGALNIVTGDHGALLGTLADHDDIDGLWHFGSREDSAMVEKAAAENMKRTWVGHGKTPDWFDKRQGEGEAFLRRASQIKNIWTPYGE